jgi:hypothetical protein
MDRSYVVHNTPTMRPLSKTSSDARSSQKESDFMVLRRIITLAIVTIVAAPGCFAAPDNNSQPFTITISAHEETVKVGEEARVHIVLTNISDQALVFRRSVNPFTAELHYTILVHDKSGKDAPETEYSRHARLHQLIGSDSATLLKPGEKLEEDTVLSTLFDLASPGEYEVQLSRPASEESGEKEIVKSNKLTITITE